MYNNKVNVDVKYDFCVRKIKILRYEQEKPRVVIFRLQKLQRSIKNFIKA